MQTTLFMVMFYSVKTQFLMLLVLVEDFYSALLEFHGTEGFSGAVHKVNVISTQVIKDPQSVKEMRSPTSLVSWKEIVKHGGLNSYIFKELILIHYLSSCFLAPQLFSPPSVLLSISKVPVHLIKVFLKVLVLKTHCSTVAHPSIICTALLLTTLQEVLIYE